MSSESTVSTRGLEFLAWVEVNKNRILVGAAVLAILISSFLIHRWRVSEREQVASTALIRLQSPAGSAQGATRASAEDYLRISTEHRSTDAGARARLLAAEALFRAGQYEESRAQFEAFRQANPLSPLAATAAYGLAVSLDALGQTNEAFQAYQDVVARHPNSAAATQAKLALADLHATRNDPQQAMRLYEELQVTAWAGEAAQRRELLLVQHPELAEAESLSGVPEITSPVIEAGVEPPPLLPPPAEEP
jgi:tetratricopeptide (TPR) repeat protein